MILILELCNQPIYQLCRKQAKIFSDWQALSLFLKYFSAEVMWWCVQAKKGVNKKEEDMTCEKERIKPRSVTGSSRVLVVQFGWRGIGQNCNGRTKLQRRDTCTLNTVFVIMEECKDMIKDRQSRSFQPTFIWDVIRSIWVVHIRDLSESIPFRMISLPSSWNKTSVWRWMLNLFSKCLNLLILNIIISNFPKSLM